MRAKIIGVAVCLAVCGVFAPAAQASNYPSQALANQTLRSWLTSGPGPCGNGTFRVCDGVDWTSCGGLVGANAMWCSAVYEEHTVGNPFRTIFCSVGYPTRVGKVSEGVARVVYLQDDCHYPAGYYP